MQNFVKFLFLFLWTLVKCQEGIDQNSIDASHLPMEHRSGDFYGPELEGAASDPWPLAQPRDMPAIKNIQVQCEKTYMRISVEFDRPFYGMIFSKGYYSEPNCVHLNPDSGTLQAQFDIYLNSCGMTSSGGNNYGVPTPGGTYIENTIIIQYDPLVQEVWDAARKLRCTWYDYYEKSVTFKPFQVDMLNAVTANFLGDNLQCWMQIQVGKGPWASEVSGIVKIGQTMTMVLAIKDDENKFDMMVRNCVAHDGKRGPIQLVDQNGCVTRPKIMGRFQKIKNFGSSASVVSYAYFQAFKFPDSMNVHFQCVIQVCRYQCPEPNCPGYGGAIGGGGGGGHLGGGGGHHGGGGGHLGGGGGHLGGGGGGFGGGYHLAGSEDAPVRVPPEENPKLPDPRHAAQKAPQELNHEQPIERQDISNHVEELPDERVDHAGPMPIPLPLRVPLEPQGLTIANQPISRLGAVDSLLGRPRAIDIDKLDTKDLPKKQRERRSIHKRATPQEMTDIPITERIIQVVAPGDLAFNINSQNETVVIASTLSGEGSHICMSTTGFAVGLIMLLLVLTVACLVAFFLYSRVRTFNAKCRSSDYAQGFDNPEFLKVSPTK